MSEKKVTKNMDISLDDVIKKQKTNVRQKLNRVVRLGGRRLGGRPPLRVDRRPLRRVINLRRRRDPLPNRRNPGRY